MLSLSPNRTNTIVKTETWTDPTVIPPYILILSEDTEGNFIIYVPRKTIKSFLLVQTMKRRESGY